MLIVFWPLFTALLMSDPLQVLITRPLAQAASWAQALGERGVDARCVPVLVLEALTDDAERQAIKNCIVDVDLYQKAIVVSRNAVDFAMEWLDAWWPQLPTGIEWFAVGKTTAEALAAHGIAVSALEQASDGAMTSETLLQAEALQQVAGEKIVIFRGQGGRGHMGEILRARGASVDYCELYRRAVPPEAAASLATLIGEQRWQPDLVAVHSGESLQHFMQILTEVSVLTGEPLLADNWRQVALMVPGERVAALATDAGFKQVVVAENATDHAMTRALEAFAKARAFSFSD